MSDRRAGAGPWIGLAFVVIGAGLLLDRLGAISVRWPTLIALALLVLGGAMVTGGLIEHQNQEVPGRDR